MVRYSEGIRGAIDWIWYHAHVDAGLFFKSFFYIYVVYFLNIVL